ncbi:MAG: hypothetical protein S4CHLAM6_11100 [Chlamydiae bacterium]|nr:hypothetical protein [Chlamydiota bacterium]
MELTLNLKPANQLVQAAAEKLNCTVLGFSKAVAEGAEKANKFLFQDENSGSFTLSVFGGLAVSSYNPSNLLVGLCAVAFSSAVISYKEAPLSEECILETARGELAFEHPSFEGDQLELAKSHPEEFEQITSMYRSRNEAADRGNNLCNLAVTNAAMTLASQALLGNNTLGLLSLAATSAVRIMNG